MEGTDIFDKEALLLVITSSGVAGETFTVFCEFSTSCCVDFRLAKPVDELNRDTLSDRDLVIVFEVDSEIEIKSERDFVR